MSRLCAGPGTSWGNILADLATSSVPEIMEMVQRDLERAAEEGRTGRSRYSSSSCGGSAPSGADVTLAVDIIETDDAIIYYADVPGLNKSDLKVLGPRQLLFDAAQQCAHASWLTTLPTLLQIRVNQQDRLLTVSGERVKPEAGSESDSSTRLERTFGSFKRELTLPKSADLQAISAK